MKKSFTSHGLQSNTVIVFLFAKSRDTFQVKFLATSFYIHSIYQLLSHCSEIVHRMFQPVLV